MVATVDGDGEAAADDGAAEGAAEDALALAGAAVRVAATRAGAAAPLLHGVVAARRATGDADACGEPTAAAAAGADDGGLPAPNAQPSTVPGAGW